MDPQLITFRDATPTVDEGLAFARYLDEAAEGFFRFALGRRSIDIIAKAFVQPDHDLSHQNVVFAERDSGIVGMFSGYTAEQHRRSTRTPLKEAAGRWNLRMRFVLTLFAPLMKIIDSISDGDFYLQAIAVDRELRGEGIGSMLMDLIEERASASGAARLALDVSGKNGDARRFYERCGFAIESRWPRLLRVPAFEFCRMTKTLE